MAKRSKDTQIPTDPTTNVELVERIATVTEELEDILAISKGKSAPWENINIKELIRSSKKGATDKVHPFLFSIVRLSTLQGLVKGRMTFNAYSTGKSVGGSIDIKKCDQLEMTVKRLGIGRAKVIRCEEDSIVIRV